MNEAEWQEQLLDLAHMLGWKHMHVRRSIGKGSRWTTATSVKGWPDLTLWNERQKRLMFVELKGPKTPVEPEQQEVLASLKAAGQEVHIWRPDDLEAATRALRPPNRIHFHETPRPPQVVVVPVPDPRIPRR